MSVYVRFVFYVSSKSRIWMYVLNVFDMFNTTFVEVSACLSNTELATLIASEFVVVCSHWEWEIVVVFYMNVF